MALHDKSTKVAMYPSGSGGGGFMTLYDETATTANTTGNIGNDDYWDRNYDLGGNQAIADPDERWRVKRLREAMEDFIRGQAALPASATAAGGVKIEIVASGTGATSHGSARAKLSSATGRIQIMNFK